MAALNVESEDTFLDQHSLFVQKIGHPILIYLLILQEITTEEKDGSFVEAKKDGFNVYINHRPPTSGDNPCNICKNGKIKIIRPSANVNNSNCNQLNVSTVLPDSDNAAGIPNFKDLSISELESYPSGEKGNLQSQIPAILNEFEQTSLPIPLANERITYTLNSNFNKDFELVLWKKGHFQKVTKFLDKESERYEVKNDNTSNGKVQFQYLYHDFTCDKKKCNIMFKIAMGASYEQVHGIEISNNVLKRNKFNVIKINGFQSYKEEIYIQGQIGPTDEKTEALRKERIEKTKRKERIPTYMRNIVICDFIFEIDFYDYYIYSIVGMVYNPGERLGQLWPWFNEAGVPISPSSNNFGTVNYENLLEGIDSNFQFFELFSRVHNGNFWGPVDNSHFVVNKLVLQLCLALGYSEAIRNYNTIKWNQALIEHRQFIPSEEDLKIVIDTHPMVTGGSFQKRKTGYSGDLNFSKKRLEERKHNYNTKFEEYVYDSMRFLFKLQRFISYIVRLW